MSRRDRSAEREGERNREVRILYVEDNEQTGPLVRDWLERHDDRFSVSLALTLDDGVERLEKETFDAIVADYRFPDGTGLDLLEAARERDSDIPFLLYSARADESVKREAREAGVDAIVPKGDSTQLSELADHIFATVEGRLAASSSPETTKETERVEQFAAEVAHDLRGQLSIAYGYLDLLEDDNEHVEGVREALADIEAIVDELTDRAAAFDGEE